MSEPNVLLRTSKWLNKRVSIITSAMVAITYKCEECGEYHTADYLVVNKKCPHIGKYHIVIKDVRGNWSFYAQSQPDTKSTPVLLSSRVTGTTVSVPVGTSVIGLGSCQRCGKSLPLADAKYCSECGYGVFIASGL